MARAGQHLQMRDAFVRPLGNDKQNVQPRQRKRSYKFRKAQIVADISAQLAPSSENRASESPFANAASSPIGEKRCVLS
jgi:hypothetical protein